MQSTSFCFFHFSWFFKFLIPKDLIISLLSSFLLVLFLVAYFKINLLFKMSQLSEMIISGVGRMIISCMLLTTKIISVFIRLHAVEAYLDLQQLMR